MKWRKNARRNGVSDPITFGSTHTNKGRYADRHVSVYKPVLRLQTPTDGEYKYLGRSDRQEVLEVVEVVEEVYAN